MVFTLILRHSAQPGIETVGVFQRIRFFEYFEIHILHHILGVLLGGDKKPDYTIGVVKRLGIKLSEGVLVSAAIVGKQRHYQIFFVVHSLTSAVT